MNRTIEYEKHMERIVELRNEAVDLLTLARAFGDYADILSETPTRGAIADKARDDLMAYAHNRRQAAADLADKKITEARVAEDEGLR